MRISSTVLLVLAATGLLACSDDEGDSVSLPALSTATVGVPGTPSATASPTATPHLTPPPTPCGDPSVTERFALCQATESEAECESAGGSWITYPFSGREGCLCSTGQAGCPCTASSDCVGRCFAPFADASTAPCSTVHQGTCSAEEPQAGCWCQFAEDGRSDGFCNDP